jgi:hypothetical protein
LLFFGSCFSEHIGGKCTYYKLNTRINPFGIVYNSRSLATLFSRISQEKLFTQNDFVFHDERYHSYAVHSKLSATSAEVLQQKLNANLLDTREYIAAATHLTITLGTAWVHKLKGSTEVVANCHKMPASLFEKTMLSTEEVLRDIESIAESVKALNSAVQLIFTVSPVRHIKEGLVNNQLSKAVLLQAVFLFNNKSQNSSYFPAYEMMMDDLRDYRFYQADLIHPNQVAVDYIWEKFIQAYISEDALGTIKRVSDIQNGLAHQPFNPSSEAHQNFLANLDYKIQNLKQDFPQIKF